MSHMSWISHGHEVGKLDGRPRWHLTLMCGHWAIVPKGSRDRPSVGKVRCERCEQEAEKQ
jgi:hypothetical protein